MNAREVAVQLTSRFPFKPFPEEQIEETQELIQRAIDDATAELREKYEHLEGRLNQISNDVMESGEPDFEKLLATARLGKETTLIGRTRYEQLKNVEAENTELNGKLEIVCRMRQLEIARIAQLEAQLTAIQFDYDLAKRLLAERDAIIVDHLSGRR